MAQTRSQDYNVDNRYRETAGYTDIPKEAAKDNSSGSRFLRNFIERDRVKGLNPIAPDNRDENKFIMPAQGGLVPVPRDGGSISNSDARMTFRNSFRAAQS
tara:strand:- start:143 stop:445 length:303 start_codon:yes stop_codon:yes gene_type:complete